VSTPVPEPLLVFFDGECGLCHRFVARTARRDAAGAVRFAPIGRETWRARCGDAPAPPDTVVVLQPDGVRLIRSEAVLAVLRALGPAGAREAALLALFPRPLRDFGYRLVSAVRRRVFRRPDGPCPLMPPELRGRFLP
jgi:predicted DCC family thiol-disulfide oxidoreductase YuxK